MTKDLRKSFAFWVILINCSLQLQAQEPREHPAQSKQDDEDPDGHAPGGDPRDDHEGYALDVCRPAPVQGQ